MNEIDSYISAFPEETQKMLEQMRTIINLAAPKAEEVISYGMPAFKYKKVLVYFAGYKNHIGFYPAGMGIQAFQHKIQGYKNSKGAVQFPLNQPLPEKLITEIVKFRLKSVIESQK